MWLQWTLCVQWLKFFICCIVHVHYFKELPFYNKTTEKPKVKPFKNIDQLAALPFYEQLSVIKTNQAFRRYAISYKVEIIERKYPVVQLEASKSSI